jgi:hypothetical protein
MQKAMGLILRAAKTNQPTTTTTKKPVRNSLKYYIKKHRSVWFYFSSSKIFPTHQPV